MSVPSYAEVVPQRKVGGVGLAATVLVGAVVVLTFVSTWTTWNGYGLVQDYAAGVPGITEADLDGADDTISTVALWFVVVFVAAGIVFIAWLWQARLNAERLRPAQHRRARGWVIGSWICPVVNLWFPFMVVDDVYRASRPGVSHDIRDLRVVPGSPVLGLWWTLWLGGLILDRIAVSTWNNAVSVDSLRTAAVVETVQAVVTAGAAVALILVIRRISAWQDNRMNALTG